MHIKTASNGRKKVVMSRAEWESIGKRAGWTVEASRRMPIFSSEATLRSTDEEDPRPRLPEVAEDIAYDAETAIPGMIHPDPRTRGLYDVDVTVVGEPRVEVVTESDEQGEYNLYNTEVDVRIVIFVEVPTEQDIVDRLSRNWLEFKNRPD